MTRPCVGAAARRSNVTVVAKQPWAAGLGPHASDGVLVSCRDIPAGDGSGDKQGTKRGNVL